MEKEKQPVSKLKKALPYMVLVIFFISMIIPIIATPFIWAFAPGVVFDVGGIFENIIRFDILIVISVTGIYGIPIVTTIIQKYIRPKFYKIQLIFIFAVSAVTILPIIVFPILNILTKV